MRPILPVLLALGLSVAANAQKRMILIDQDGSGPGGSNQMAMMVLLQSPKVDVLGITMVTGNAWRDEETQHTLRMLEIIGRTDIPVANGAVFPLVRTEEETRLNTPLVGQVSWLGAWGGGPTALMDTPQGIVNVKPDNPTINIQRHDPYFVPQMIEGAPRTRAIDEDAVHFLIRKVHEHPHQVTVYACGPLTNIALAIAIDPTFAETTQGIVIMGGSLNPQTTDPEFAESPRHEFNFWFDPEAAHIVLHAHWPDSRPNTFQPANAASPASPANSADTSSPANIGIVLTTVDVSIKARFTQAMLDAIARSPSPAAQYIAKYSQERYYMWDELAAAAWIDPTIITKERLVLMDVDLTHGPSYGNTLTWTDQLRPQLDLQRVHAQLDLDLPKFEKLFVELMTRPGLK